SFLGDLVGGWRYVSAEPDLLLIGTLTLTAGTALGLLVPLLRPFVDQALHGGDLTYARLVGAFGLGGLVGPWVGYRAGRALGSGRALLLGFAVEATLMLLWSRVTSPLYSYAILFIWGANIFAMIPCQTTYV